MPARSLSRMLLATMMLVLAVGATAAAAPITTLRLTIIVAEPGMIELERTLIEAFEKSNRNIKVELVPFDLDAYLRGIASLLGGPTPPDVMLADTGMVRRLAASGACVDLNPYIQRDRVLRSNFDKVPASVRVSFTWKGAVVAAPRSVESVGLVYNVAHFGQAGLEPPQNLGMSWDWNTFVTYAQKLSRPMDRRWGMSFIYEWAHGFWLSFVLSNGGRVLIADGAEAQLSDTGSMAAFRLLADMGRGGLAATPADHRQIRDSMPFGSARASMILMYPFGLGALQRSFEFPMAVAPIPASPYTKQRVSPAGALGVVALARSPSRTAATTFALWFLGDEAQTVMARSGELIPSREDMWPVALAATTRMPHGIPNVGVYIDLLRSAVPDPASPWVDSFTLYAVANQALGAVMSGEMPVEPAMVAAERAMNELLRKGQGSR